MKTRLPDVCRRAAAGASSLAAVAIRVWRSPDAVDGLHDGFSRGARHNRMPACGIRPVMARQDGVGVADV